MNYERRTINSIVNLCTLGAKRWNYYRGDYFINEYFEYISKKPFTSNGDVRYTALYASYVSDNMFEINLSDTTDDEVLVLVNELISNITSDNLKSNEIASFITDEIEGRFISKSNNEFSEVIDNRVYYTEMYVEGYFVSFSVEKGYVDPNEKSLTIKIQ